MLLPVFGGWHPGYVETYDAENGPARDTSASSFELIIETCRIQSHRFFVRNDNTAVGGKSEYDDRIIPHNEVWGRITNMRKRFDDTRIITQEFEVRPKIVQDILLDNGFSNINTCIAAWKTQGVLDFEDDTHPYRKRKIDPNAAKGANERVFVFRVFESIETDEAAPSKKDIVKPCSQLVKKPSVSDTKTAVVSLSNREYLLSDIEEAVEE